MTIFIAFIMVSSVIGFLYAPQDPAQNQGNSQEFNGIKFIPTNNRFIVEQGTNQLIFDYLPSDLTEIQKLSLYDLNQQKLYLLYNSSEKDDNQEYVKTKLAYNLRILGKQVSEACISEIDCPDIPVKSCNEPSIYLESSNQNKIRNQDYCLVISGDSLFQSKSADKIIQQLLGI